MSSFTPQEPEEYIMCEITRREAELLQKLRTIAFGKCTVQKANGILIRTELVDSQLITGKEEITIAVTA